MSLQAAAPRLLLASGSASRRAVLQGAGLRFDVRVPEVDEGLLKHEAREAGRDAATTTLLLAAAKALPVARAEPDALVIGGDQILVCDGRWFDKPAHAAAAREQLAALRGRTHTLVTALLCCRGEQVLWRAVARPRLTMRDFSDAFLDTYLDLEAAQLTTTVGAYRLEGPGVQLFAAIEGEHAAILGLPLIDLLGFLRRHGVLAV